MVLDLIFCTIFKVPPGHSEYRSLGESRYDQLEPIGSLRSAVRTRIAEMKNGFGHDIWESNGMLRSRLSHSGN